MHHVRKLSDALVTACREEAERRGLTVGVGVGGERPGPGLDVALGAWWPEMFLPNVQFSLSVERRGAELMAACLGEHDPHPTVVHRCNVVEADPRAVAGAVPPLMERIVRLLQRKLDPMRG